MECRSSTRLENFSMKELALCAASMDNSTETPRGLHKADEIPSRSRGLWTNVCAKYCPAF
jgi:hypothetical protein